jgi:hypothetical protein
VERSTHYVLQVSHRQIARSGARADRHCQILGNQSRGGFSPVTQLPGMGLTAYRCRRTSTPSKLLPGCTKAGILSSR